MSNPQLDGNQSPGTSQAANQGTSGGGGQSPSGGADELRETLNAIAQRLDNLEARTNGIQSKKDTRIASQEKEISSLRASIADYERLKESMGDSEAALEALEGKQTLSDIVARLDAMQNPPSSGTSGTVNAADVFTRLNLDLKDPRVAAALGRNYASADEAELAAFRLQAQLQNSPTPTEAQAPTVQGSAPKSNLSRDELTTNYQNERNAIMQANPNLDERIRRLAELKTKYREAGLSDLY